MSCSTSKRKIREVKVIPTVIKSEDVSVSPEEFDLLMEMKKRIDPGTFSWDEISLLSKIRKDPNDSLSLYFLGKLYYKLNDMSKASKYLGRSTKLNTKNAAAFHLLATIYDVEARTLKEERKSWDYLEKARSLDPHNTEILLEMGIFMLAFGELGEARQRLEEAKAHAIKVADLCAIDTVLSEVYIRLNNPSASKSCVVRAKTLNHEYYREVRYWLEGFLNERKKWQGRLRPRHPSRL